MIKVREGLVPLEGCQAESAPGLSYSFWCLAGHHLPSLPRSLLSHVTVCVTSQSVSVCICLCLLIVIPFFNCIVDLQCCQFQVYSKVIQLYIYIRFPGGSESKESACNGGDPDLIRGSGRSPGKGNGYPLQCSCLENSMHQGAWQATVHGVAKSQT